MVTSEHDCQIWLDSSQSQRHPSTYAPGLRPAMYLDCNSRCQAHGCIMHGVRHTVYVCGRARVANGSRKQRGAASSCMSSWSRRGFASFFFSSFFFFFAPTERPAWGVLLERSVM